MPHHSSRIIGSESAAVRPNTHRPHSTPPLAIHSVRLPKRDRVRSENVPNTMFATSAMTEPTALIRPMNEARWSGAIWSTSCGTRIDESAVHTMPVMIRLNVKPAPRRTTSLMLTRSPLAATIGSRMSRNAESGSGSSMRLPPIILSAILADWAPASVTYGSATIASVSLGTARRATAALSASLRTLS